MREGTTHTCVNWRSGFFVDRLSVQVRSSIPVQCVCAVERVDENAFQQQNVMQVITQDNDGQLHTMYIQCKVHGREGKPVAVETTGCQIIIATRLEYFQSYSIYFFMFKCEIVNRYLDSPMFRFDSVLCPSRT